MTGGRMPANSRSTATASALCGTARGSPTSTTRTRSAASTTRRWRRWLRQESGARRVVVFDHTLRTADDELRSAAKIREVVRRVHNDYTEWSAPQRVRQLMGEEAEALLARRFAIMQVWRPIRIRSRPGRSRSPTRGRLSPADMVVTERRYQDRIGQTAAITYNKAHRWYWFPQMRPDEALVFKVFEFDDGRPRPLHRAHRLRGPDLAARRPAAREHRNPHARVFLRRVTFAVLRRRMMPKADEAEAEKGEGGGLGTARRRRSGERSALNGEVASSRAAIARGCRC